MTIIATVDLSIEGIIVILSWTRLRKDYVFAIELLLHSLTNQR